MVGIKAFPDNCYQRYPDENGKTLGQEPSAKVSCRYAKRGMKKGIYPNSLW
jgi:hypothetical protein